MDPLETLLRAESLYGEILQLTLDQEALLRRGDWSRLPDILLKKTTLLNEARRRTEEARSDAGSGSSAECKDALGRLGALLAELVQAEQRCEQHAPSCRSQPPKNRAIAAYGNAGKNR